jgi:hypothetical protein
VLAVVEDDQNPLITQGVHEPVERFKRGRRPAGAEKGGLADAERGEHGGRHLERVADSGQLDQPGAALDEVAAAHPLAADLGRQAGFAGPARPDERDEAARLQQPVDMRALLGPADEAGEPPGADVAAGRAGLRAQDRGVQVAQGR